MKLPAALLCAAMAGIIYDESAHYARGICHKARFVRKTAALLGGHLYICLVQERRRSKTDRHSAAREFALRNAVQLRIKGGEKGIGGCLVSPFSSLEKSRQLRFHNPQSAGQILAVTDGPTAVTNIV